MEGTDTALAVAAVHGGDVGVLAGLLDQGRVAPDACDELNFRFGPFVSSLTTSLLPTSCMASLLHIAAGRGHEAVVAVLLKHGATVDVRDGAGHTPLHLAAIEDHLACAQVKTPIIYYLFFRNYLYKNYYILKQ